MLHPGSGHFLVQIDFWKLFSGPHAVLGREKEAAGGTSRLLACLCRCGVAAKTKTGQK
jgi:hypothetical protein